MSDLIKTDKRLDQEKENEVKRKALKIEGQKPKASFTIDRRIMRSILGTCISVPTDNYMLFMEDGIEIISMELSRILTTRIYIPKGILKDYKFTKPFLISFDFMKSFSLIRDFDVDEFEYKFYDGSFITKIGRVKKSSLYYDTKDNDVVTKMDRLVTHLKEQPYEIVGRMEASLFSSYLFVMNIDQIYAIDLKITKNKITLLGVFNDKIEEIEIDLTTDLEQPPHFERENEFSLLFHAETIAKVFGYLRTINESIYIYCAPDAPIIITSGTRLETINKPRDDRISYNLLLAPMSRDE